MKNTYTETNELSPEALFELRKLTPEVGANRWAKRLDNLIDDSWLDEFIEDYNF